MSAGDVGSPRAAFGRRALLAAGAAGALISAAGAPALAQEARDDAGPGGIDTQSGPHVATFDVPGLSVGVATDSRATTGCTVFRFAPRAFAVLDVRGGAPGTIFTDKLRDCGGWIDAVVFAGGSVLGLEAACGVTSALVAAGAGIGWATIPLVAGAAIYDFGGRATRNAPDRDFGRAALGAAVAGRFPLGGRGAGAGARCGKWLLATEPERSGQGAASASKGSSRVAVFTVVNSLGAIVDRSGTVVRGHRDPKSGKHLSLPDLRGETAAGVSDGDDGNTTLTLVAVNHRLDAEALRQLAREVHTSMARAIQPFHTSRDGDVLFAVTTNAIDRGAWNPFELAVVASECAWDAVLASFRGRE